MDKLIICETDRGRYAVRPMNWAGIWNKKGQIKEPLNHLALFIEEEDAKKFIEWKTAEEQGKLLKLPCAVGDTYYLIENDGVNPPRVRKWKVRTLEFCVTVRDCIGKTAFLTREEAEAALKEL